MTQINKLLSFLTIGLFVLSLNACNKEPSKTAAEVVSVENAHIRALPPGQRVTAMYMELKNPSKTEQHLVKIEGSISPMIELHTHTQENGVMKMSEVESIPVPANATVAANPGSYHVMIMGLPRDLQLGEKLEFTFIFKDESKLPVIAEVKKIDVH